MKVHLNNGVQEMSEPKKINWAAFAKDWQDANTVEEVSKKHGITNAETSRFAGMMRKKGVDLKKFRIGVQADFDVDAINAALKKKGKK